MIKKRVNFLLILIIFIASVLRLWQLGSVPPSPDWDEAALAYDAKSLYLTGRDEYGEFLPAVLRSFDDYKPALYAYLSIPTVFIFGMNTFAVRLPSAVFGILTVITLYFLVKELFKRDDLALLSAFFLAISPWHIQFSRIAFETNVGLFFNAAAVVLFIKGLKKPWLLILAALFAGLNLSIYQSERVFTPLLILALVMIYRKELFKIQKRYLVGAVITGILSILPLAMYLLSHQQALVRVRATSIFSNQTPILARIIPRLEDDKRRNDLIGLVLDNRRVIYSKLIIESYLVHYDLNWLFIKGDINRHRAPGMGLLYLVTLPLVFVGIYKFIFEKFDRKSKFVVLSWFILAPIPASITFEVPHAVRTLNVVPIYQLFSALGVLALSKFVLSIKYKLLSIKVSKVLIAGYLFLAMFNFAYYLNQYFVQQNYFHAADWQYGYRESIVEIEKIKKDYKKIVVSNKQPMDKSYMFFLFYLDYPPQEYQKIGIYSSGSFDSTHHFENYEFRPFDCEKEKTNTNILYVGSPKDFPDGVNAREAIAFPDGKPAILLVDPKDNS
jgi:4-amino-4-deoxy-L-arabinose transferase-like glycosyltransferase